MIKFTLKKISILFLIASLIVQATPTHSREATMCDGFRWGTDLQAHFSEYRVAVCINGMFPSHMVVYKNSDTTNQIGVRVLNLEEVTSYSGGESPVTIGKLPNGFFYKARDRSVLYKLVVMKGRSAEFEIFVGNKLTYHRITKDIVFVDLIPP